MARLVPNPQALVDQLLRRLPHPAPTGPPTDERILDAALEAFTAQGIRATTMSQIARDAEISREWLYKRFRNRDAIVAAITRREAVRLIDGLVVHSFRVDDFPTALTEVFVYAVEFLRDHALLQRVLANGSSELGSSILGEVEPILAAVVQAGAGYLEVLGGLTPEAALVVAETVVRLGATITLAPRGNLDLHDPEVLRRYAATVIPAVLSAHTPQPHDAP